MENFFPCITEAPSNHYFPNRPRMNMPIMHFLARFECSLRGDQRNLNDLSRYSENKTRGTFYFSDGTFRGPLFTGTVTWGQEWVAFHSGSGVRV
ncbi:uncharacterized protein BDV17DRAFT_158483 [Aspergillus undulatus]|uniref:uncharacterized protein n=1 Tax=Aspergillus undulatus TaxID=1810928 RepID=UPI003CCDDB44